ncbi:lipo-like protein [Bosea sp. (in: a-proteobacteria)]|uniref:lipo-like protein n=1 Tax=Bosea sp. (in: a-proteobacteria) TaxID=1871050 RepID=UPI002FC7F3FA
MNRGLEYLGRSVVRFITRGRPESGPVDAKALARMRAALRPGDVLLVEGSMKVSAAIKYLTQSTWSHAALYVGETGQFSPEGEPLELAEVEMDVGCVLSPLSKYGAFGTRICRPQALDREGRGIVVDYVLARLGTRYDLKNILDLARWLIPIPWAPAGWRRRMIALGSGDPTRAICSTLIAKAFEAARYPVLPTVEYARAMDEQDYQEVLHIRHHSLYMPRDFDISPYFAVVKPTLESGFDYKALNWAQEQLLAAE